MALSYEFRERRRLQLLRGGVLFGALLLICFIISWISSSDRSLVTKMNDFGFANGFLILSMAMAWAFYLGISVSSSLMFGSLSSSRKRTAYFMVPLSQSEKYAGQLMFYYFGFPVVFLLCLLLAMACNDIISRLVWDISLFKMIDPCAIFKWIKDYFSESALILTAAALYPFLYASFFVVGSVFFTRHTFLKMLVVMTVAGWIGGSAVMAVIYMISPFFHEWTLSESSIIYMPALAIFFELIVIIFNLAIAGRRLHEIDII